MKSLGYMDSLQNMELLATIAKKINVQINWKANFSKLDSPQSFLDVLSNKSEYWIEAFCNPWDE